LIGGAARLSFTGYGPPRSITCCGCWRFSAPCPTRRSNPNPTTSQLLHRNVQRFRGGLVSKAHRLFVSLNSRRESNKKKKRRGAPLVLDAGGSQRHVRLGGLASKLSSLLPKPSLYWPTRPKTNPGNSGRASPNPLFTVLAYPAKHDSFRLLNP